MASRDESNRVRLQVWVTVDLADRLVVAARDQDRSVSKEAARRLEASFGSVLPERERARNGSSASRPGDVAGDRNPVRSESTEPQTVDRVQTVERLQREVPAVRPASAFPAVPQDLAGGSKPRPRSG